MLPKLQLLLTPIAGVNKVWSSHVMNRIQLDKETGSDPHDDVDAP